MSEQRVRNRLCTSGSLHCDVLVAHDVREGRVTTGGLSSPIPEGEAHGRSSAYHPGTTTFRIRSGQFVDNNHELLLKKSKVCAMPGGKKNGIVRAITISSMAVATLFDTVPILSRHAVDSSNLVIGQFVALAHVLKLL